jgi:putative oxidoreductase
MPFDANSARLAPPAHAILRIVVGYLFLIHGSVKLFHVPHVAMYDGMPLLSLGGLAAVLDFFGGALIVLGAFTRVTAFVLCGEMAVAYFLVHASGGTPLLPMLNDGEPAVLFCFVFLFLAAAGAGPWSVDARRGRAGAAQKRK